MVFLYLVLAILLYFFLKYVFGIWEEKADNKKNNKLLAISILIFLILVFGDPVARWGNKIPGSFWERNEYTGMYYVYLNPGDYTTKFYRVPAKITATWTEPSDEDEGGNNGSPSERIYEIEYAVMPNGGFIKFEDEQDSLEPNKIVQNTDADGREWKIQLTCDKAK